MVKKKVIPVDPGAPPEDVIARGYRDVLNRGEDDAEEPPAPKPKKGSKKTE